MNGFVVFYCNSSTKVPYCTTPILMESQPEVTILLLGDPDIGKTTFLSRIGQSGAGLRGSPLKILQDKDQPFLFDIKFSNHLYLFKFSDTARPLEWITLKPNVIVLCYNISNRLSLINLQRIWIKEIKKHFTIERDTPILVLGLKRDLRSETDPNGIIYPEEAHGIAQQMRCDRYMECSAATGELMHEVFEDICRTVAITTTSEGGMSEGGCGIM